MREAWELVSEGGMPLPSSHLGSILLIPYIHSYSINWQKGKKGTPKFVNPIVIMFLTWKIMLFNISYNFFYKKKIIVIRKNKGIYIKKNGKSGRLDLQIESHFIPFNQITYTYTLF